MYDVIVLIHIVKYTIYFLEDVAPKLSKKELKKLKKKVNYKKYLIS